MAFLLKMRYMKKYVRARGRYTSLDVVEEAKRLPLLKWVVDQIELPWDATQKKTGRNPADVKYYRDLIVFIFWQEAYPNVESERSFLNNLNNDKETLRTFGFEKSPDRTTLWRIRLKLSKEYREKFHKKLGETCVTELFRKKRAYRRTYYKAYKARKAKTAEGNKQV
jgi:hypothetical protein